MENTAFRKFHYSDRHEGTARGFSALKLYFLEDKGLKIPRKKSVYKPAYYDFQQTNNFVDR
jgi:hypothetical protein